MKITKEQLVKLVKEALEEQMASLKPDAAPSPVEALSSSKTSSVQTEQQWGPPRLASSGKPRPSPLERKKAISKQKAKNHIYEFMTIFTELGELGESNPSFYERYGGSYDEAERLVKTLLKLLDQL